MIFAQQSKALGRTVHVARQPVNRRHRSFHSPASSSPSSACHSLWHRPLVRCASSIARPTSVFSGPSQAEQRVDRDADDASIPACDDPALNPARPPHTPVIIAPLSHYHPDRLPQRLLIYKKVTTLEEIRRGVKLSVDFPYLREDSKVLLADREHQHTISVVRATIAASGAQWREVEAIDDSDVTWCDAIICVGGDGTFLKATRAIHEPLTIPIVGVNSAPSSSFGFFCAADHASFPSLLTRLLSGKSLIWPLWRMRVCVNNKPVGHLVLNEMLYCNPIPSGTTRYLLTNGSITQQQQSSGIWISTAAGSTGAIHGAGGELMNLSDWRFQYQIRELFSLPITHPRSLQPTSIEEFPHIEFDRTPPSPHHTVLTRGYIEKDFSLVSRMMSGCLYLDGSVIAIPVQFNDKITVRRSVAPLEWIAPTRNHDGVSIADHWELVTGLKRAPLPTVSGQSSQQLCQTQAPFQHQHRPHHIRSTNRVVHLTSSDQTATGTTP